MALKGKLNLVNLSADPTTNLASGQVYYNTTDSVIKYYDGSAWVEVGASSSPWSFSSNTNFWDFTGTFSTRTSSSISDIGYMARGQAMSGGAQSIVSAGSQGKTAVRFGSGDTSQYTSSAYPITGTGALTCMASFYNMVNNGVTVQHIMHFGNPSAYQAFGICFGQHTGPSPYWVPQRWGNHRWGGNEPNATDNITGQGGQTVIFVRYDGSGTSNCRYYRNNSNSPSVDVSQSHTSLNIATSDGMRVAARISGTDVERSDVDIMGCGAFNTYLSDADCDTIANWCNSNYG